MFIGRAKKSGGVREEEEVQGEETSYEISMRAKNFDLQNYIVLYYSELLIQIMSVDFEFLWPSGSRGRGVSSV